MTDNKIFKIIITFLIIAILIVLCIIFLKKYFQYRDFYLNNQNPFKSISILNEDIKINNQDKIYNLEASCNIEENNQIINYELKNEDSKINIDTIIYNQNEIITDINNATNLIINIEINNNLYRFNITCRSEEL